MILNFSQYHSHLLSTNNLFAIDRIYVLFSFYLLIRLPGKFRLWPILRSIIDFIVYLNFRLLKSQLLSIFVAVFTFVYALFVITQSKPRGSKEGSTTSNIWQFAAFHSPPSLIGIWIDWFHRFDAFSRNSKSAFELVVFECFERHHVVFIFFLNDRDFIFAGAIRRVIGIWVLFLRTWRMALVR